jgi:hypothetical protein
VARILDNKLRFNLFDPNLFCLCQRKRNLNEFSPYDDLKFHHSWSHTNFLSIKNQFKLKKCLRNFYFFLLIKKMGIFVVLYFHHLDFFFDFFFNKHLKCWKVMMILLLLCSTFFFVLFQVNVVVLHYLSHIWVTYIFLECFLKMVCVCMCICCKFVINCNIITINATARARPRQTSKSNKILKYIPI